MTIQISESSIKGVVEVKNLFGMKAQLASHGFSLSLVGYTQLSPNETLNLSIKQWKVPIWYPKWMFKQWTITFALLM